ncbi:putative indole-3-pyruvate monooxygenase YUCCA4 [Camellia lanceoleosa]|uniref:Indole-3-pyruvate monooxygenase YUCCA4 n=1 Tax=Camellia lanceoleosa TaxID=1840588 RepID=A0ACC0FLG4_9ERIC|nr:putative indole-3-pyruvate monooxygenase YUCCA4 [Camellia lanceoleosa]
MGSCKNQEGNRQNCLWVHGPIIVGAGPSGNLISACLKNNGVRSLILERSDCIASLRKQRTYDRLKLHLPKQFCELPLFGFPENFPKYPTKHQFISYMESYASHFNIEPSFEQVVKRAEFDSTIGFWRVQTQDCEYISWWIIVATGENVEPAIPEIPGIERFDGPVVFTSLYTSGSDFRNQSVLLVGCGNSGMEVSLDLCKHNATPHMTNFDAPSGNNPIALDFTGMGKGEAWVNGQSIGRYWPTNNAPSSGCTNSCNYRGPYNSNKCLKNCGKPSQQLYHVPRSWLQSSGNTLVLFEEMGGDPTQLSFATKQIGSLCSHVSESHPQPVDMWSTDQMTGKKSGPMLSLECPFPNQIISSIKFASFGTPRGTCGSFSHSQCSDNGALSII